MTTGGRARASLAGARVMLCGTLVIVHIELMLKHLCEKFCKC